MYFASKDSVMNIDTIKRYIEDFKVNHLPRLIKLDRYYKNDNAINRRVFNDKSKPNNKISHSFAEYIVKTNVSLLIGSPITYTGDNIDEYTKILEYIEEQDLNVDTAINCAKYGYSIQYLYLDKDKRVNLCVIDNKQTILIYTNDIEQKLMYAIRFFVDRDIYNVENEHIEVYMDNNIKYYKNGVLIDDIVNILGEIPIIIYKNNTDSQGDYENVMTLIDEYDLLTSDMANENDYFNNCYLYLNTDSVIEEDIVNMKENRVIYGEALNPQFILKQSNSVDLENEKNRIVKDIHKLSFVPDLSDESFANNVSGVAMKYKLFGTLNNILSKQRKFKKGLSERNNLIFNMMNILSMNAPLSVDIAFTIDLPENNTEIASTINMLRGLVSDETLLSLLPFVTEPKREIEEAKESVQVSDTYE